MITNTRWINTALMGTIFGVGYRLSPVLRFSPASWNIVITYLGIAVVLALVTVYLSHLITKERDILSSKG